MEKDKWLRPWHIEKFDDLYDRDERFFAILTKGVLAWLNKHIVMYNKPIQHFIFNTGSSYMYIESNGYKFTWSEASGEDWIYMQLPRCIVTLENMTIPTEDLSQPYARGTYERRSGDFIKGYNAEISRIPIEMSYNLTYYCGTFNETIVLMQEIIDKILFQRYFKIIYLGQIIQCAIEFPADFQPELNQIDLSSPDPNQKTLKFDIRVTTNYPLIDERTEIMNDKIISKTQSDITVND